MTAATRPEDYLGVLQSLTDDGCSYFLEGGKAVNFWAEYFTLREGGVIELEKYQPFTSKDCDLWVSMAAFDHFQAKIDGKLKNGTSPADGQLAVFTTCGEPPLKIDLMSGVFGIPPADIGRLEKRALEVRGVRLLDPLFLFKGKCHNLVKLPQGGRQDDDAQLDSTCLFGRVVGGGQNGRHRRAAVYQRDQIVAANRQGKLGAASSGKSGFHAGRANPD